MYIAAAEEGLMCVREPHDDHIGCLLIGSLFMEQIKKTHLPILLQARSYTESLNAQDVLRPIPRLIKSDWGDGNYTLPQSSSSYIDG